MEVKDEYDLTNVPKLMRTKYGHCLVNRETGLISEENFEDLFQPMPYIYKGYIYLLQTSGKLKIIKQ